MLKTEYPYYIANEAQTPNTDLIVRNKFTSEVVAKVPLADAAAIDRAIGAAVEAAPACRKLPSFRRTEICAHMARRLMQRQEEFAHVLAVEVGKPIREARGEVARAIETFQTAAEEATRLYGEYLPLDVSPRAPNCQAIWRRFPVGPCALISPFNFPLNLSAHKIAPALAVGCSFVLKPASDTPISALLLGDLLAETDLPKGAFSILPASRQVADRLVTDDRLKLVSFTGSPEVGWDLKNRCGKKKIVLELGGNAGCIVDRDSDLEHVVGRLIVGAFYQSGQSCISVQRIFVHEAIYPELKKRLIEAARRLRTGDPLDEDTFLGPLISEADARRVEQWTQEAVREGARLLCGGRRNGALFEATLLENVPDRCDVSCREVFGPVAILEPFIDFAEACRRVNASRYGLQAGVFTRNLHSAFYAFNELEVGGVVINDIPSFRVDAMPYGGVKDSGLGREGLRFAMEEMTEMRLLVLKEIGSLPQ